MYKKHFSTLFVWNTVDKGFVAQKALTTAFIPLKILPHVCCRLLKWKHFRLLLASDAIMHARCRVHRSREIWQWLLVPINYTMNIRIFVYKRMNTLTNEYPNIQYILFSTRLKPRWKIWICVKWLSITSPSTAWIFHLEWVHALTSGIYPSRQCRNRCDWSTQQWSLEYESRLLM